MKQNILTEEQILTFIENDILDVSGYLTYPYSDDLSKILYPMSNMTYRYILSFNNERTPEMELNNKFVSLLELKIKEKKLLNKKFNCSLKDKLYWQSIPIKKMDDIPISDIEKTKDIIRINIKTKAQKTKIGITEQSINDAASDIDTKLDALQKKLETLGFYAIIKCNWDTSKSIHRKGDKRNKCRIIQNSKL